MEDPYTQKLLTQLAIPGRSHPNFVLKDVVLRFKGRLWVSNHPEIQQHIISAMHASALGGGTRVSLLLTIESSASLPGIT